MTFESPQFLFALAALPALMVFMWRVHVRRAVSVLRLGDPALVERLSEGANGGMSLVRLVLWFVGVTLIVVALARPQWGSEVEIVEQRGVQVMVALDVSRSMLSQDVQPTRLDRAKLEISDLISRLRGDTVGIVLFSGASFVQFPLTADYATARTYLNSASPRAISRQGTVIGEAIETAMGGFNDQRVSQKVIVVMTDGENHEGDPVEAARQAAEEGAVVYTVGFGSPEGSPVAVYDEQGEVIGFRQDAEGSPIVSRLDEEALQRIAEVGGGRYFRAGDPGAMGQLLVEIESFQDESLQSELSERRVERFQLFLLAGALSLFLTGVLTDRLLLTSRRRLAREGNMWGRETLIALPAVVLLLSACGPTPDQVNNAGHEPYLNADYEAALDAYQGARERAPKLGEPHYNAGNTLYRMEEFDRALQGYDEALKHARGELRSQGFFNRGNAAFRMQQYALAVEAYKEALRMNPDDEDTKHNLELALKQLPPQDRDDEQDSSEAPPPQAQPPQSSQDQTPPQDQSPPQEPQTEPMTEEQARQALEAVGEAAQTLQERREQTLVSPDSQTEFDW